MDRPFERCVVVAGLLRLNNGVLLMRERGAGETQDRWVLPTGEAYPGELLTDALIRILQATIGLHAEQIAQPVCTSQLIDHQRDAETLFVVLEVTEWTGKLETCDPYGKIREMGFFHMEDATRKLHGASPYAMCEPLEAVLRGDAPLGALWLYRARVEGLELVHGPGLTTDAEVRI